MSEQQTSPRGRASHERSGDAQRSRDMVLTPVPAGSWPLMLGLALAGLGPLGGFLAGSMAGIAESTDGASPVFSAIYLYLFIGIAIGALGVLMAGFGGLRLYRDRKAAAAVEAGAEAA